MFCLCCVAGKLRTARSASFPAGFRDLDERAWRVLAGAAATGSSSSPVHLGAQESLPGLHNDSGGRAGPGPQAGFPRGGVCLRSGQVPRGPHCDRLRGSAAPRPRAPAPHTPLASLRLSLWMLPASASGSTVDTAFVFLLKSFQESLQLLPGEADAPGSCLHAERLCVFLAPQLSGAAVPRPFPSATAPLGPPRAVL